MDAEPPAIELRGLARHFGERTALSQVSVRVPRGATLAVLGRNGAGKSTLLRILASLLRPHAGEVLVFGEPLPRRAFAVRGKLGLLAHEPLLYRELTGRENLDTTHACTGSHASACSRCSRRCPWSAAPRTPCGCCRGDGAADRDRRAVLHEPALLLLDEPRANLDPARQRAGRAADRPRLGPHAGAHQP